MTLSDTASLDLVSHLVLECAMEGATKAGQQGHDNR